MKPILVQVKWDDARLADGTEHQIGGWSDVKAVLSTRPAVFYTTGYLVKRTKRYVWITSTVEDHGRLGRGMSPADMIPRGCIRWMRRLTAGKRLKP